MTGVTVIIMNWARPRNVLNLIRNFYQPHPLVKEIIVFDAAPSKHRLYLPEDELKTIYWARMAGRDLGLTARFAAATMAQTEIVLLIDDDVIPGENTVTRLIDAQAEFGGTVSTQGRRLTRNPLSDSVLYNIDNVYGDVDVVLTRLCCTKRSVCCTALIPFLRLAETLPGAQPYGNGEDIVLSYATRLSGQPVRAQELSYRNIGADDDNAISVRFDGHLRHRTDVARWCEKHMSP